MLRGALGFEPSRQTHRPRRRPYRPGVLAPARRPRPRPFHPCALSPLPGPSPFAFPMPCAAAHPILALIHLAVARPYSSNAVRLQPVLMRDDTGGSHEANSTTFTLRWARCEPAARSTAACRPGTASRLSPCRRGYKTPKKLAPRGADDGAPEPAGQHAAANTGFIPSPATRTRARACVESPARACLRLSPDLTPSARC